MVKLIFLLKRKPGITHQQFREHYETSHAELAKKHVGHLMLGYQRHYPTQVSGHAGATDGGIAAAASFGYDCVAEWTLPDEAAVAEFYRIAARPEVSAEFMADEDLFLDRDAMVALTVEDGDIADTGTSSS